MKQHKRLNLQRQLRARRSRKRLLGTSDKPRLSVFRSNKFIYAQLIDDSQQKTLVATSGKDLIDGKFSKTDRAKHLGKVLAEKAKKVNIDKAIFDRGRYKYHGRVRALADGAREGGLKF